MEIRVFIPFELLIVVVVIGAAVVRRQVSGVRVLFFDLLDQRVQLTLLIESQREWHRTESRQMISTRTMVNEERSIVVVVVVEISNDGSQRQFDLYLVTERERERIPRGERGNTRRRGRWKPINNQKNVFRLFFFSPCVFGLAIKLLTLIKRDNNHRLRCALFHWRRLPADVGEISSLLTKTIKDEDLLDEDRSPRRVVEHRRGWSFSWLDIEASLSFVQVSVAVLIGLSSNWIV